MRTPRLPATAGEFDTVTMLRDVVAVLHELANGQAALAERVARLEAARCGRQSAAARQDDSAQPLLAGFEEAARDVEFRAPQEEGNGRGEEGTDRDDRVGGAVGDRGAAAGVRVPRGGQRLGVERGREPSHPRTVKGA